MGSTNLGLSTLPERQSPLIAHEVGSHTSTKPCGTSEDSPSASGVASEAFLGMPQEILHPTVFHNIHYVDVELKLRADPQSSETFCNALVGDLKFPSSKARAPG